MKIPFTQIRFRITRNEKIGVAAAAASVWPLFSLAFGSAPLSLLTMVGTPIATTLITSAVVAVGYGVKKLADIASEMIENYAADHPGSFIDRHFAGEYRPDHYTSEDYELDSDAEKEDDLDLQANLAQTTFDSYTQRTLTSWRERSVRYTVPALDITEMNNIPVHTTRSGMKFH